MHSQLETRRAASTVRERESKRREGELTEQLAAAQAKLSEVGAATARTAREQLGAVVAGSQAVGERHIARAATREWSRVGF